MYKSLRLFTYSNIPVYIHWSMFLIVLAMAFPMDPTGGFLLGFLSGIGKGLLLFGVVLAHEFAHALTAQRYGGHVESITLMILGGAASITKFPTNKKQEFAVVAAGPLLNFVLFFLVGLLYLATGLSSESGIGGLIAFFLIINLVLGTFNLLPIYPMDGGRMLNIILSSRMSEPKAAKVSRVLTYTLGTGLSIVGLYFGLPMLVIVMVFLMFAAYAENKMKEYDYE